MTDDDDGRARADEPTVDTGDGGGQTDAVASAFATDSTLCPTCGGGRRLDLGVCLPCAGEVGTALLFVRRPANGNDRAAIAHRLSSVLPSPATPEAIRLASGGNRAVAAVPALAADAVAAAFAQVGVPLRVVGISLPFVACGVLKPGGGLDGPVIIDLRYVQLSRLTREFVVAIEQFTSDDAEPESPNDH